jgi:hypothetical protein
MTPLRDIVRRGTPFQVSEKILEVMGVALPEAALKKKAETANTAFIDVSLRPLSWKDLTTRARIGRTTEEVRPLPCA